MLSLFLTYFGNKLQTKPWLITLLHVFFVPFFSFASFHIPDTIPSPFPDTLKINDTIYNIVSDTNSIKSNSSKKFTLSSAIDYTSADSIIMNMKLKKAFMYGNASIKYEEISLKANTIIIDFNTSTVFAYVAYDSAGNAIGMPDFTQGTLNFKAKELSYNFESKKGLIKNVITKEGEGYLHGSVIKKIDDKVTNVGKGVYTTCDLEEHPHFALKYTRAKVIAGEKIITGPAYMDVEGIPLPIALPFGLFPNKKGRSSGLIIPKYGEAPNRGFYLEDGGYYLGINDYLDLKLTGDIYSRGSWAVKPLVTYRKKYKFNGSFNFKYAINVLGVKGTSDYSKRKDFFVTWSHRQDAKARPNSVFSASVQAGTSSFNQFNPGTVNDYLNNQFSSSISYDLRIGNIGNLTASARHSQVTSTKMVTLTLPEVSFGINRIYPFKRKVQTGKARWYEAVSITYNFNARNEISSPDSMLFRNDIFNSFVNGVKHSIPVSGSFKVLKFFNWSNSVNYSERWYSKTINKTWIGDTIINENDTTFGYVDVDTITGFKAARDYSFSSSLSTTVYGMKQFKKGPIRAIRHVVRPSVGFSYLPDFGREELGYYRTVQTNAKGDMQEYSIFGGSGTITPLYGYPGSQKSGAINFGITNNLEMKVRSKKDTITGMKKVMLIDNLSLSTSYDLTRDSLRWAPLSVSARTTLFKKLQISYSGSFNFYAADAKGKLYNKFQYEVDKRLLRFSNANWNLSVGHQFAPKAKNKKPNPTTSASAEEIKEVELNPQMFIDWDNPWSLRIDYNLSYNQTYSFSTVKIENKLIQTMRIMGDLNVTDKWKFSMQTGYDFETKDFAFTQVTIYRNLHCWEMRMSWVPYGQLKSWNFQINAKSSLLQDLKLTRKKDFRDNL